MAMRSEPGIDWVLITSMFPLLLCRGFVISTGDPAGFAKVRCGLRKRNETK